MGLTDALVVTDRDIHDDESWSTTQASEHLTSTGMMHTVYIGGLTAANHSCPRLRPVASMAANPNPNGCASLGSGVMATPSPSGATRSAPAAAEQRRRCGGRSRSWAIGMTLPHSDCRLGPVTGWDPLLMIKPDRAVQLLRLPPELSMNGLLHLPCGDMHGSDGMLESDPFPIMMPMRTCSTYVK